MFNFKQGQEGECARLTQASPILSLFPWYTAMSGSHDWEVDTSFQVFIENIRSYESVLLGTNASTRCAMDMQRLLRVGPGFTSQITGPAAQLTSFLTQDGPNAVEWTRICGLISAYRLLDVITLMDGRVPRTLRYEQRLEGNKKALYGMDKLGDWPRVLLEFRKIANKVTRPTQSPVVGNIKNPIRLLHMIIRNEVNRKYSKVESNLLHAAMHVACMKELPFTRESYPDLPERVVEALDYAPQSRGTPLFTAEERKDLHDLVESLSVATGTGEGLAALRAPLQLSLLISPIYLLLPMQLVKKSFNRQVLISTSVMLGNAKTDLILEVERAIWNVVFALASGTLDPKQVIFRLVQDLPWPRIESEAISENESSWFQLENTQTLSYQSGQKLIGRLPPADDVVGVSPSAPGISDDTPTDDPLTPVEGDTSLPGVHPSSQGPSQPSESGSRVPPTVPGIADNFLDITLEEPAVSSDKTPMDEDLFTQDLTPMQVDNFPSHVPPSRNVETSLDNVPNGGPFGEDSLSSMQDDAPTDEDLFTQDLTPMQVDKLPSDVPTLLQTRSRKSLDNVPNNDPFGEDSLTSMLGDGFPMGGGGTTDAGENTDDQKHEAEIIRSGSAEDGVDSSDKDSRNGDDDLDLDDGIDGSSALTTRRKKKKRFNPQSRGESASKAKKRRKLHHKESSPSLDERNGDGDTSAKPIDVDLYSFWEPTIKEDFIEIEEISLQKLRKPPKVSCDKVLEAFDAEGKKHEFRPKFHYADYNDRLKRFFACIARSHDRNGNPLHIAYPDRSGFAILSYPKFKDMSPGELQKLLARKNVVVTGCPAPVLQFDEAGLRTLSPLDSQVSIQDYTCPPKPNDDFSAPETISGLVSDILENAKDPDGKILNGLEFPMWNDSPKDRSAYATDVVAFDYVRGKPHCGNLPYPTNHMRWGLAGTANTVTFPHIDSDGFATFVQIMCGKKVWAIYRQGPEIPLSSINTFLHKDFILDDLGNNASYGFEAIVLRPGDLLFLQPGLPHFVYGPENTICHGGHFYGTCLMQKTLQSLVHSFVISDFITNITHPPSRLLLRRIVLLYGLGLVENRVKITDPEYSHLPNVQTFDGLLDLLSASILAILGNVLDFRTYSAPDQQRDVEASVAQKQLMAGFDCNNIPSNERQAICHARGVAFTIFDWVRERCIIKDANRQVVKDLPSRFLVQILKSLLNYKAKAMQAELGGAPHCNMDMLKAQVENVLKCDTRAEKLWKNRKHIRDDSLAFGPKKGYSVEWLSGNNDKQAAPSYDKRGMTPFDDKFWKGRATGYGAQKPQLGHS